MAVLCVEGPATLSGEARLPPDKSIAHRALILSALAKGESHITPALTAEDPTATINALWQMGVQIETTQAGHTVLGVEHPHALRPASIDCKNSGTTMRLLSGVLAASSGTFSLSGDDSLNRRPMERLLPLLAMGAKLEGQQHGDRLYPPLTISGAPLQGARHTLSIASAQVKSALLLAGLYAKGETFVKEPMRSRDHTERMLRSRGVELFTAQDGGLSLKPIDAPWLGQDTQVPGDFSAAAFVLAAALLTNSSNVFMDLQINPTRTGFLDAVEQMGAVIHRAPLAHNAEMVRLSVRGGALSGTKIAGLLTLRALDEIPLIAMLAAFSDKKTVITDAGELRFKESDRLKRTAELLTAFGARSTQTQDGLIIEGRARGPASVQCYGDHRLAMGAAVMGLAQKGVTEVHGAEAIGVSFPGFDEVLRNLGANVWMRP